MRHDARHTSSARRSGRRHAAFADRPRRPEPLNQHIAPAVPDIGKSTSHAPDSGVDKRRPAGRPTRGCPSEAVPTPLTSATGAIAPPGHRRVTSSPFADSRQPQQAIGRPTGSRPNPCDFRTAADTEVWNPAVASGEVFSRDLAPTFRSLISVRRLCDSTTGARTELWGPVVATDSAETWPRLLAAGLSVFGSGVGGSRAPRRSGRLDQAPGRWLQAPASSGAAAAPRGLRRRQRPTL